MKIKKAYVAAVILATGLTAINPAAVAQQGGQARPDRPERPERPERPDRPERPERPDRPGQPPEGARPDRQDRLARMAEQLQLTEEQKVKVKPIMDGQREQLMALRQDQSLTQEQRREKMQAIRKETNDKIVALLTPEQKTKWTEMEARRGERTPGGPRGEGRGEGQGRPQRPAPGQN